MGKKAVVLNSGGVDSTTCVGLAVEKYGKDNVSTLSVFYGQKHDKELECAKKIAAHYEVAHYEVDLSAVMQFSNCPLLSQSTEAIRHESYAGQIAKGGGGMVRADVPFRNGLLLSSVTALAVSLYPDDEVEVYYGAHADDAAGRAYADCSPEFADAMNKAINIGTYEKVTLTAPLINMNKGEVVKTGLAINVPYELTWSCYEGGEKACGTCGTCIDRINAFKANNIEDPIDYVDNSVKSL